MPKDNPFYWQSIKAKDIKTGNIISNTHRTHPRLIDKVTESVDLIALWESFEGVSKPFTLISEEYVFHILMNKDTNQPATQEELLEVSEDA